jgi:hypothetical protein
MVHPAECSWPCLTGVRSTASRWAEVAAAAAAMLAQGEAEAVLPMRAPVAKVEAMVWPEMVSPEMPEATEALEQAAEPLADAVAPVMLAEMESRQMVLPEMAEAMEASEEYPESAGEPVVPMLEAAMPSQGALKGAFQAEGAEAVPREAMDAAAMSPKPGGVGEAAVTAPAEAPTWPGQVLPAPALQGAAAVVLQL